LRLLRHFYDMPINPNVFSNLILCLAGIFVFYKYLHQQPYFNRLLWSIFLLSISLTAFTELLMLTGLRLPDSFPVIALSLERTLGSMSAVSATWCLIMHYKSGSFLFYSTVLLGLFLFYCIVWYHVEFMGLIIQPLCLIITLLICCLGLAGKQTSALWIILAMLFVALSTKSRHIPIPMSPLDINRYMMTLAVVCSGRALKDEFKILF
jgi:hypothetical protein